MDDIEIKIDTPDNDNEASNGSTETTSKGKCPFSNQPVVLVSPGRSQTEPITVTNEIINEASTSAESKEIEVPVIDTIKEENVSEGSQDNGASSEGVNNENVNNENEKNKNENNKNADNEDANKGEETKVDDEIPITRQPVVLPDGMVMPSPRVESVNTSWKTQHLTAEQINDYCKRLFKFKTVNFMHFK